LDDGWRDYFPAGSLDSRPDLHRELAEWFSLFLQRMMEPPLHPVGSDQALVIRLLCLPTWSQACSIRVAAHGLSWELIAKELNGEAGFEVGELVHRGSWRLSVAESAQAAELWPYVCFWSLPAQGEEDVLDGTTYVLEAAEHGRYRVVYRDDPEWGDTFGEFCQLLLRLAAFAPR
jgi:hypothetical protein